VISGIPGSPTRTTTSTYYATTEYWNRGAAYLRALHTTSVGTASTTNSYDNPLTTANLTQQSSWNSETGRNINRSWTYTLPSGAVNGNVVTATDPNEIITKTLYDARNLYPTEVDLAYGRTEQRTTRPTYDFNSGLLLSSTDDNHVTITNTYDNLGRQKKVEQSGDGGSYRSTSTEYDDLALSVTTAQDQTALSSTTYYDAVGRVRLTVDAAGSKIQKAYRAGTSGVSYELESNPYTAIDQTMGWTITTRNAISAVTTVQTYKGADPPAPWGSASASNLTGTTTTTAYDQSVATCSGPTTNVTDQASNTTKYCQDGLGRLVGVTDAAGNLAQNDYDLLDDLIKVTQSGQTRAFEYSSLGRLLKACNPETGTASCTASPLPDSGLEKYTYDDGGNLKTKKDARSITASYDGYDGLNRPQTVSYTKADGSAEGTATVTYTYDQDWKGALSSVSTSVGTSVFSTAYTHDGFGRIHTSTQTTVAAPGYTFVYTYSLADQLTKMQYPSGRTVSYVPDSAGRINAVKNEATGQYYGRNIGYTPAGAMFTMTLGNGLIEQRTWNDRLQLTGLTAAPQSGTTVLGLGFYPCSGLATSCSSGNIGSIQAQTIALPGLTVTQNYGYDVLARISSANEGTGSWKRGYGYDAVGNRYVDPDPAKTSGYSISSFTPTGASSFDANNRLNVNDSADDPSGNGNQTAIGGYSYTYDAENRMISANLGGNGIEVSSAGYVYDGEGNRVQKISCPAGTRPCTAAVTGAATTTYIYDAFGNLAAEYGVSSSAPAGCGTPTCYLSVDQVGSTRLVTDANGNAVRRYDYTPYGEELWAGIGGRATAMGYQSAPDGFNPKFTGQQRDPENLLDYFHARYYSPQQGRFVSADPENAGADPANPQTWNGYTYVGNSPLNITDPNGESWITAMFGAIGFIAGAVSGNPLWWYAGLMTGAEAAGAQYTFEEAVNSGNIAAIAGMFIGGPGLPDYGGVGGTINTGGIYGSGNTGPFVFSVINVNGSVSDWLSSPARGYLMQVPVMASIIKKLEKSSTVYTIHPYEKGLDHSWFNPNTNEITWASRLAHNCNTSGAMSPALNLGHELAHAAGPRASTKQDPNNPYFNPEEQRVITGPERIAAKALGECVRTSYDPSGNFYVNAPTGH
jgi:RHS repeat-associated protein